LIVPGQAMASRNDEAVPNSMVLAQMQQRAESAGPRDQCFLYTEVLHGLTELAGRQMAAGDDTGAAATLERIDAVTAEVQKSSSANARRLKNAEMLLQVTTRRLTDMAHVASTGERSAMQRALEHLDRVHTQVLALVFSK
jgi:hypothetical protein